MRKERKCICGKKATDAVAGSDAETGVSTAKGTTAGTAAGTAEGTAAVADADLDAKDKILRVQIVSSTF